MLDLDHNTRGKWCGRPPGQQFSALLEARDGQPLVGMIESSGSKWIYGEQLWQAIEENSLVVKGMENM